MEHQAPHTPLGARTSHSHPAYVPVVAALTVAVAIGGYLALANSMNWWPYREQATEPGWKTYVSPAGFSFEYPPTAELFLGDENFPGLVLAEGGQFWIETNMGILGRDEVWVNHSGPTTISIGPTTAERYTYEGQGGCHGIAVVLHDGGEGDRDFLISYDDCYVGGGSPDFPSPAQVDLYDRIVSTFRITAPGTGSGQEILLTSPESGTYRTFRIDTDQIVTRVVPAGYSAVYPLSVGFMPPVMLLEKDGAFFLWSHDGGGDPYAIEAPREFRLADPRDRAYATAVINEPNLIRVLLFDHRDATDFGGGSPRAQFIVDFAFGTAEKQAEPVSTSDRQGCTEPDRAYQRFWIWPCGEGVGSATPLELVSFDGTTRETVLSGEPGNQYSRGIGRYKNGSLIGYGPDGLYLIQTDREEPEPVLYAWSPAIWNTISGRGFYDVSLDEATRTITIGSADAVYLLRYGSDRQVIDVVTLDEPQVYANFVLTSNGKLYYPIQGPRLRIVDLTTRRITSTIPIPTSTPTPMPVTGWKPYVYSAHGFSFWYPAYFEELPEYPGSYVPDGGGGTLGITVTDREFTGIETLYESFVPREKLQKIQVDGRTVYSYRDGDAGCGGSSYYFPLSGAYVELSFGDCEGDLGPSAAGSEDTVVGSFRFNTTPGSPPSVPPAPPWTRFVSSHFTLSFRMPANLSATDQPNAVTVQRGAKQIFRLQRYDSVYTKASAEAGFRATHTDIQTGMTLVDDVEFRHLEGVRGNASAMLVLFDRSALLAEDTEPGIDVIWTAGLILRTMRFSR